MRVSGPQAELVIQLVVAVTAIRALIATHPDPDAVRQVFDELFGQIQAGLLASGEPLASTALARQMVVALFEPPT